MLIVITYDVSTESAGGRKRLRKIAKECVNYGQRVQNSVFECEISSSEWLRVKNKLVSIIDETEDSLRFYYLGEHKKAKTEHIGKKPSVDVTGVMII